LEQAKYIGEIKNHGNLLEGMLKNTDLNESVNNWFVLINSD